MDLISIFLQNPSVSIDSRQINKGDVYFALKGSNFDGNRFIEECLDKGASYAVCDDINFYEASRRQDKIILVKDSLEALQKLANEYRNLFNIPVLAITGSNGKTTSKELCAAVLAKKFKISVTFGNLNNHIGVPLTLLRTPKDCEFMIVEMGANHIGEIELLSNIANPTHGVITNIGKAHLEGFGGLEGVKKGKSELFKYLESSNGTIFYNAQDEIIKSLLTNGGTLIPYSPSDFVISNHSENELSYIHKGISVKTNLVGDFNLNNIALAYAVGGYFGVEISMIEDAITNYIPSNNRSQLITKNGIHFILDAYNSNPTSLLNSIKSFIKNGVEKKALILGDMLELGADSLMEHQNILNEIRDLPFKQVILIGQIFGTLQVSKSNFQQYLSVSEAQQAINPNSFSSCTVLLKGSRGIAVEKILEVF